MIPKRLVMFLLLTAWWYFPVAGQQGRNTLIITHPTVSTLERIRFLISEDILVLPEDMHLILAYHQDEAYEYANAQVWLDSNSLPRSFEIQPLSCPLTPEVLHRENACTENFKGLFQRSAGIIFFGGPDLPPVIYGQEMNLLTEVQDPYRHYWEASLIFHLLGRVQAPDFQPFLKANPSYAMLGICLGMQTMHVATGGTLIQDIPTVLYQASTVEELVALPAGMLHRNYFTNLYPGMGLSYGVFHPIRPFPALAQRMPGLAHLSKPAVLSSHHQGFTEAGKGWEALASSMDGQVVEMIGHGTFRHVLGVQFHPEVPAIYNEQAFLMAPGNEGFSYAARYPGAEGLDFHLQLWSSFSRWVRESAGLQEDRSEHK